MAGKDTEARMALEAWRREVPHGAYMQRIRLSVTGEVAEAAAMAAASSVASPASQESLQTSQGQSDSSTPTAAIEVEEAAPIVVDLPPFESAFITGSDRMALNVGGPVWAMDWLPQPSTSSTTEPPAATNAAQKTGRRKPAANGKAQRTKGGDTKKTAAKSAKSESKGTKSEPKAGKSNSSTSKKSDANGECNGGLETIDATTPPSSNGSSPDINGERRDELETLQWRYLALAAHPACQVDSDGKLVKTAPPDHYYAVQEGGRNLIQIWAVPMQSTASESSLKSQKESAVKPRLVYAIDHSSNVAWDLQWCPLASQLSHPEHQSALLGVLAVCFGDGSLRVFEVPKPPVERLQMQTQSSKGAACIVETLRPVVIAKLPRILQLCVQWSPHQWNLLLTGGSDGSVSLWNIEAVMRERESVESDPSQNKEVEPLEPQRRFQDADTIGKQEPFDWGRGWVAIRAVAWSPYDEHLFATTGNDSVFKVWDVREPRLCLRSHRIRSTWGLALQWMDHTSIQISGDQGSIYVYDILSGSYQKLHFHPQIDSPVWDLQFGRRGATPLLISSCTSGSIRAAPAKKLYRAPQNCVELCRLSGCKDANVEQPYKSLSVSFDKRTVLGSGDVVSPATREFCERDAALHRLRLTSTTAGENPCYLAAAGHAGLVLLLELQDELDNLITRHFMPPSKKIGRPKKVFATTGAHLTPKKPSGKKTGNAPVCAWRKVRTLGSFAKAKGMHTALSKYKKKRAKGKLDSTIKVSRKKKKYTLVVVEDDDVEDAAEEEEEAEYQSDGEEEEEVSDSDLSRMMDDENSDDERISASESDDHAEEEGTCAAQINPEEARLMAEFQLDLSEEDAIALAIQMSELKESTPPAATGSGEDAAAATNKSTSARSVLPGKDAGKSGEIKAKAPVKTKTGKGKKRALPSKDTEKQGKDEKAAASSTTGKKATNVAKPKATPTTSGDGADKLKAPGGTPSTSIQKTKTKSPATTSAVKKTKSAKKKPAKATGKQSPRAYRDVVVDQAAALQFYEYQLGMTEEDAIKEAIRLSEAGNKRRSTRVKHPVPQRESADKSRSGAVASALTTAALSGTKGGSGKQPQTTKTKDLQKETKEPTLAESKNTSTSPPVSDSSVAETQVEDQQQLQAPRRLRFSPKTTGADGKKSAVPVIDMKVDISATEAAAAAVTSEDVAAADAGTPDAAGEPAKGMHSVQKKQETKKAGKAATSSKKKLSSSRAAKVSTAGSASASSAKFPQTKRPPKRSRSTGAKSMAESSTSKKCKTTPTTSGRSTQRYGAATVSNDSLEMLSEEDALLMALKMSEVEY